MDHFFSCLGFLVEWKKSKRKESQFIMLTNVKYCFLKHVSTERECVCMYVCTGLQNKM